MARLACAIVLIGVLCAAAPEARQATPPPAPTAAPQTTTAFPNQEQGRRGGGAGRQSAVSDVNAATTPAEVERLFDAYELIQAQTALQLDNGTYLTFMPRFQQLQKVRHMHQQARQRQVMELAGLLKAETATDETTLTAKTKALDDIEAQEAQEIQKSLSAIDQVLTVVQRARLRTFMFNMEKRKLDLIQQARQAARGGGAAGAPAVIKKT